MRFPPPKAPWCRPGPKFFKDIFQFGVALFYHCFRGMRLWAADGTGFRLPDEQWLGNRHGRVPSTRLPCTTTC